jgi:EAL domain-containing protein (putative c-di-GMP-specific phosphodiesterase class I)
VRRTLERFALPGDLLEFDIDERVLADPANSAMIERLAQTGASLTLDGFGTGYSSLGYLRQHPISAVKIDRSFLVNVPGDSTAATLIETIIVMAHSLQKRVVAEGIESIEQLDFLRERRCDSAQGYYLARPLPAAKVTELLSSRVYDNSSDEARATG